MDTMTLLVAAMAAAAIFLIAIGIATSGGGSAVSARLERYASGQGRDRRPPSGQGGIQDMIASERDAEPAQQGRRAARLRGEPRSRHRPGRPEAQGQRVPRDLGGVDRRHPGPDVRLLGRSADARQPAVPDHRRADRLPAAAVLAEPPQGRPPRRLQQAAARTRSRSWRTRCGPAPRSSRRSSWSSASRGRRSRPSSPGSSARSTSACRSSRRSRTWSAACGRTTSS